MSNEPYSQTQLYKKSANERLLNNNNNTNKNRKFRWSSCFSFITKFKKSKSTNDKKVRLSQSYQEFEQPKELEIVQTSLSEYIEVEPDKAQWKPQQIPPPSLSPPPRQNKSKRESMNSQQQQQEQKQNVENKDASRNRRPLLDPTLTPRVKPRSIKTTKQPSLLRLSLDAELLQSTDKEDNDSLIRTGHSSVSLTPTSIISPQAPFRSGTLGATNNPRVSAPLPPLPHHIPNDIKLDRPISTAQSSFADSTNSRTSSQLMTDSPVSISAIKLDDDEDRLTLRERRRRRSPLSIPNSDQLTLDLVDSEPTTKTSDIMKRQTYDLHNIYMNHVVDDIVDDWRQQEEDPSRQEAMLILEGKKKSTSIMPMEELDRMFEKSNDERTTRTTKKSYEEKKNPKLDMITENKVAANYSSRVLPQVDATPDTPPYHKQTAPSLISSPSTPNSIDSSVMEHDDYLQHSSLLASSD